MWVAIDIAKTHHVVLVEHPNGRRRHLRTVGTVVRKARAAALMPC